MNYLNLKTSTIITGKDKDADQFVSFNVAYKKFDPYTSLAVSDEIVVVSIDSLTQEIANLQATLADKQALLADCLKLNVKGVI